MILFRYNIQTNIIFLYTRRYIFRIFIIASTKRHAKQVKKKAYAKASHVREIRKKINAYLTAELAKLSINDVVRHFIGEKLNDQITKLCQLVYPL
jgi:small subunit ribosomal protein S3Ae